MLDRREMMKRAAMAALATGFGSVRAFALDAVTLPIGNGDRPLVKYPQKRPMIGLTQRPPQLETPFSIFNDGPITPNNAFFVRYHLAGVPLDIDPDKFTLEIKGKVDHPLKLSLKDIRKLPAVELTAVNQCSGNSRGFFDPRVAGGQLGNGAMGNARWHGVPLKTVLDKAGVQQGAKQITLNGMDGPVSDKTPDFVKALDIDHARDGEVMLAYGMNGEDLPLSQRLPAAPDRAGLLRHLLGQAPQRNHRDRQRVRRLLDEIGLPDSRYAMRLRRSRHRAEGDDPDQPLRRSLVHHQRGRWRETEIRARRRSRASPLTAARASRRSRSRPMAARPGRRRSSARISGNIRSGNGSCRSNSRPAATTCRFAPPTMPATPSRATPDGIRPAICATWSKPFASPRREEN